MAYTVGRNDPGNAGGPQRGGVVFGTQHGRDIEIRAGRSCLEQEMHSLANRRAGRDHVIQQHRGPSSHHIDAVDPDLHDAVSAAHLPAHEEGGGRHACCRLNPRPRFLVGADENHLPSGIVARDGGAKKRCRAQLGRRYAEDVVQVTRAMQVRVDGDDPVEGAESSRATAFWLTASPGWKATSCRM